MWALLIPKPYDASCQGHSKTDIDWSQWRQSLLQLQLLLPLIRTKNSHTQRAPETHPLRIVHRMSCTLSAYLSSRHGQIRSLLSSINAIARFTSSYDDRRKYFFRSMSDSQTPSPDDVLRCPLNRSIIWRSHAVSAAGLCRPVAVANNRSVLIGSHRLDSVTLGKAVFI